jgi:anti-sigma regulatory factor (Ser/Thr protein kinase)
VDAVAENANVGDPRTDAAAPAGRKSILILSTYAYGRPGLGQYLNSFFSTLIAAGMSLDDVRVEFLDLNRFPDRAFLDRKRDLLLRQYSGQPIDMIVAGQQLALNYLLDDLQDLAPGAPVMAINATAPPGAFLGERRLVVQKVNTDFTGTIELALKLFPRTERVLAVVGSGIQDMDAIALIRKAAAQWRGKLIFEYTQGLSLDEIHQRAAHLRPRTIILYAGIYRDGAGVEYVPFMEAAEFGRVAGAPVFSPFEAGVRFGFVGGSVFGLDREGEQAAQAALAVLNGTMRLTKPPTQLPTHSIPMFDWRQIVRWRGDARHLPRNAIFVNRPPGLWEHHKEAVIVAGAAFAGLTSLVVRLQSENIRRRRAEIAARESEVRLRAAAEQRRRFIRDILASATEGKLTICFNLADLPEGHPADDEGVALDLSTGHAPLRQRVNEAGAHSGMPPDRLFDLEIAVGEAGMNAIVHAGGGRGYVRATKDGIRVWIDDHGHGIPVEDLPHAALKRGFTTTGSFGHGMKMMLQTVDHIYLLTGPEGTTVVIDQAKTPPPEGLKGW